MTQDLLDLETRAGLPEPLRVLLADYPREGWASDPGFQGTVRFWLDRHMMFRKIMALLQDETEALLDGRIDPQRHAGRLSRYGGMFVGDLHGHHQIEDIHYFPVLARQDSRVAAGFEILDRDHHAIDGHLAAFVAGANDVLQEATGSAAAATDPAGAFHGTLTRFGELLERHLTDEEELVVPVILKYGESALPH